VLGCEPSSSSSAETLAGSAARAASVTAVRSHTYLLLHLCANVLIRVTRMLPAGAVPGARYPTGGGADAKGQRRQLEGAAGAGAGDHAA